MPRLVKLEVSNIKRIRYALIHPDGTVVTVGGLNAQGKSSLLDAISMLYGGKNATPPMPLRKGETAGFIEGTEDNGVVTRREITAKGKNALTVRKGEAFPAERGPQGICDAKTGPLSFDPLAFFRTDAKAQHEAMRKLAGIDFTELDAEIKTAFDERTMVNREVAALEARVKAAPTYADAPKEMVSAADMLTEIERLEWNNRQRVSKEGEVQKIASDYKALRIKIEGLQAELAALGEKGKAASEDLKAMPRAEDTSEARQQLQNIEALNNNVRANASAEAIKAELLDKELKSGELTKAINVAKLKKDRVLKDAKFPVKGLSLGDACVTYNDIPLEQASQAEQLRISAMIGFALTPKDGGLRVMLIRDGSLLDTENRAMFAKMAEENDTQCWIEVVGTDGDVVVQDGEIVSTAPPKAAGRAKAKPESKAKPKPEPDPEPEPKQDADEAAAEAEALATEGEQDPADGSLDVPW
jgi:hypothetical protein